MREHLEDRGFSPIHKIVLDLHGGDLHSQLLLSTADINTADVHGRTPLWWSVRRKDVAATRTLLFFLADATIADHEGYTPIHCAAIVGEPDITADLLTGNGDGAAVWNEKQGHPLRTVVMYHSTRELIEPFIAPGVNVDDNSVGTGDTAIHRAGNYNNAVAIQCLIEHGANVDVLNRHNETPLNKCFGGNSTAALDMLLSHGATYRMITLGGENILHTAAGWSSSVGVLQVLERYILSGVNVDAKDKNGETPLEIIVKGGKTEEY